MREGWIQAKLGIGPTVLTPFQVTAANEQQKIYLDQANSASPTARWIVLLYSPPDPKWTAQVNRLRVLLSVERYFYAGSMRFGEVSLANDASVFKVLIGDPNGIPVPTEPTIWLTDPVTHISVQYKPDNGRPIAGEATQQSLEDWLWENHVVRPPANAAIDVEKLSQALMVARGERQAVDFH